MASRVVIKRKKAAQKVIKNGDKVSYLASSSSMAFLICEVVVVRSSLDSGITRVSSYNDRGSYNVMGKIIHSGIDFYQTIKRRYKIKATSLKKVSQDASTPLLDLCILQCYQSCRTTGRRVHPMSPRKASSIKLKYKDLCLGTHQTEKIHPRHTVHCSTTQFDVAWCIPLL